MNFDKAKQELKVMAKGQYCGITQDVKFPEEDEENQKFTVYISEFGHCFGKTWSEAFENMKARIELSKKAV